MSDNNLITNEYARQLLKVSLTAENEDWDADDYSAWVEGEMCQYDPPYDQQEWYQQQHREEMARIEALKPLITEYQHDENLPELPERPDGSLHGIGFIYDEDRDDRVLVAIDNAVKHDWEGIVKHVVAIAEHEGSVNVYSRTPTGMAFHPDCDSWCDSEYVPYRGCWREMDRQFINECVCHTIGYRPQNGVYDARFVECIGPQKSDNGYGAYYTFKFRDNLCTYLGYADVPKNGPNKNNRLGRILSGLKGKPLLPGESVCPSDYYGKQYRLVYGLNKAGRTTLTTLTPLPEREYANESLVLEACV